MGLGTFVHEGRAIDYTPTSDTPAGTVIDMGTFVGITKHFIAANTLGALHLMGVFDVTKDSNAIGLGATVYWFQTSNFASATSSSADATMGKAVVAALAGDATVRVLIYPNG